VVHHLRFVRPGAPGQRPCLFSVWFPPLGPGIGFSPPIERPCRSHFFARLVTEPPPPAALFAETLAAISPDLTRQADRLDSEARERAYPRFLEWAHEKARRIEKMLRRAYARGWGVAIEEREG
jgi:hypothetical protein